MISPITYTFEELVAHKESGILTDEAIAKLRTDADAILEKPILVITNVTMPRPSGQLRSLLPHKTHGR